MSHFPDRLKIKVDTNKVTLAIRSTENRVDEYSFSREVFAQLVLVLDETAGNWVGPEEIQVKIQESTRRASLAVRVSETKREVHRIDLSSFSLMMSQYHSQAKGK